jgi:hypothetical protein
MVTIQLLLVIAVIENLAIYQKDIKSAYLASNLDEKIFMEALEGYNSYSKVL